MRRKLSVWIPLVAGFAAIATGASLDGYAQAVALELGAAFALIGPIVFLEQQMQKRVEQETAKVEDALAEQLSDLPPAVAAHLFEQQVVAAINRVAPAARLELTTRDGGADALVNLGGRAVAIEAKSTTGALPARAVSQVLARQDVAPVPVPVLLVSRTRPTASARLLAESAPTVLRIVTWQGPQDDDELRAGLLSLGLPLT